MINTYLVRGFYESGKSNYIEDCLKNDFFYKRGKTLLVLFEDGEEEFDEEFLLSRNTELAIYPGAGDPVQFLTEQLEQYQPDRLYLEDNIMLPELVENLPEALRIVFTITIIDGSTLDLYYRNLRQQLQNMIKSSDQVIFNRCPRREQLDPYANTFRVMNSQAVYLWEGPGGYHEKAFGVMVPYDIGAGQLTLTEEDFVPFYLDSLEKPQNYEGKEILLPALLLQEIDGKLRAGRYVMTCCAADIQFLSFAFIEPDHRDAENSSPASSGQWVKMKCHAALISVDYGRKELQLIAEEMLPVPPVEEQWGRF